MVTEQNRQEDPGAAGLQAGHAAGQLRVEVGQVGNVGQDLPGLGRRRAELSVAPGRTVVVALLDFGKGQLGMGLQLAIEEVAARPARADHQQIVIARRGRGLGCVSGGGIIPFHCELLVLQQVQDERNSPQRSGGGVRLARFGGQNGIAPGLLRRPQTGGRGRDGAGARNAAAINRVGEPPAATPEGRASGQQPRRRKASHKEQTNSLKSIQGLKVSIYRLS